MLKPKIFGARSKDPRQLSLDLGIAYLRLPSRPPSPPGPPTGRIEDPVFFAHLLAEGDAASVSDRIIDIRYQYGLQGRPRPPRVLHISLYAAGPYAKLSAETLARLKQGAETIRARPFKVTFDRVTSFERGGDMASAIVLLCSDGKDELTELHNAFGPALEKVGLRRNGSRLRFKPHLTLLYDRKVIPETPLDEPITITVRDFALIHSLYGHTQYDVLGRWPLNG
ncbi:2'-5' RNA ligase family protein [Inquilinus sp. CA228]|uniref:2'-5' RNA ligase family protein n=1 Tax=Inquilinus sp. CA228 TaxID=3455609 RepID=UPI003F8D5B71